MLQRHCLKVDKITMARIHWKPHWEQDGPRAIIKWREDGRRDEIEGTSQLLRIGKQHDVSAASADNCFHFCGLILTSINMYRARTSLIVPMGTPPLPGGSISRTNRAWGKLWSWLVWLHHSWWYSFSFSNVFGSAFSGISWRILHVSWRKTLSCWTKL